jgi:hypothetical protein
MGRDRLIILFGVGVLAVVLTYLYSRALSGDVPVRTLEDALAPEASALAPSRLKTLMKDMAEIDHSIEEASDLLTGDDAIPIHYSALMLASIAETLKKDVPRDVAKDARPDWGRMLDDMIVAARRLAEASSDPEKADVSAIQSGHKALRKSCVVCHSAFGLSDSGLPAH